MKDKGILEYIEAAKKIKSRNKNVNFNLIGPKDNSHNRVDFDYIKHHHDKGTINYLGFKNNVKPFIAESHVLYYHLIMRGSQDLFLRQCQWVDQL